VPAHEVFVVLAPCGRLAIPMSGRPPQVAALEEREQGALGRLDVALDQLESAIAQ